MSTVLSKIEELKLIARCTLGDDRRAFGALVEAYQPQVRRFFLNLTLGDEALSDDLAQETFIKAYTGLNGFGQLSSFSTWLYRIAYNVFYDHLRSQHEVSSLETAQVDALYHTEQADFGQHADLYQALGTLKEMERTCITLFYMDDLSIDRIASITGCPSGTVKSHLKRGKEKLSTYLRNNGYER